MPSALILYQFFYPDDVVSSVHMTELAEGLVDRGWDVTAMPCNRSCRSAKEVYPATSTHHGISIKRIWRPNFPQSSGWGRLANCAWMVASWALKSFTNRPDVVVIGTDPILSVLAAIVWKLVRPNTQLVHWCFDLYPEAAVADGLLKPGLFLSMLRLFMGLAYKRFDLIADLGSCMRDRLALYQSSAKMTTLPPWALAEPKSSLPVDADQRRSVFGDAKLALMYSGNFGRAHSYAELLGIAREMRDLDAHFAFCVRGNRVEELKAAVNADDRNVTFAPFVPQEQLEARLSAADIHVVSLRSEWTGMVVPSKFFGALAAGRPVLFIGSEDSYVARTIREYGLGWVCSPGQEKAIAGELRELLNNPKSLPALHQHCHRVYQERFSRVTLLDRFDCELREANYALNTQMSDRFRKSSA